MARSGNLKKDESSDRLVVVVCVDGAVEKGSYQKGTILILFPKSYMLRQRRHRRPGKNVKETRCKDNEARGCAD